MSFGSAIVAALRFRSIARKPCHILTIPAVAEAGLALDAKVIGLTLGDTGLLCYVIRCLLAVLVPEDGPEVCFAILAAVDDRGFVIQVPLIAGPDLPASELADAAI